jgi:hypothetical protein
MKTKTLEKVEESIPEEYTKLNYANKMYSRRNWISAAVAGTAFLVIGDTACQDERNKVTAVNNPEQYHRSLGKIIGSLSIGFSALFASLYYTSKLITIERKKSILEKQIDELSEYKKLNP